jgi:hypothetical protein
MSNTTFSLNDECSLRRTLTKMPPVLWCCVSAAPGKHVPQMHQYHTRRWYVQVGKIGPDFFTVSRPMNAMFVCVIQTLKSRSCSSPVPRHADASSCRLRFIIPSSSSSSPPPPSSVPPSPGIAIDGRLPRRRRRRRPSSTTFAAAAVVTRCTWDSRRRYSNTPVRPHRRRTMTRRLRRRRRRTRDSSI